MTTQLNTAISLQPDGIIVSGYAGESAVGPLIDTAEMANIRVTGFGPHLQSEQRWRSRGFGHVGTDLYQMGYDFAREAIARSGVQAGERVFVWGNMDVPALKDRTRGIIDALAAMTVIYKDVGTSKNNITTASAVFTNTLKANPGVKLVITDHPIISDWHKQITTAASLSNTSLYLAGIDLSSHVVSGLKDGWTDLAADDNPWLQGYQSVIQLCATLRYGVPGVQIESGADFIDLSKALSWVSLDEYMPGGIIQ